MGIDNANKASDVVSNPIVETSAPKLSSTLVTCKDYLMSTYKLDADTAAYLAENDDDAKQEYADYLQAMARPSFKDIKAKQQAAPSLKAIKAAKKAAPSIPNPSNEAFPPHPAIAAPVKKAKGGGGRPIAWTVTIGKQVHEKMTNKSEAMRELENKTLSKTSVVNGKMLTETKLVTPVPPTGGPAHYFDSYVQQGYITLK